MARRYCHRVEATQATTLLVAVIPCCCRASLQDGAPVTLSRRLALGHALNSLGGTQARLRYVFLPAADDALAGRNPYMDPDVFEGPPQAPYAYPPVLALVVTPLTALPETVDGVFVPGVFFTLLLIAATVAGLFLLDVRDWRCYPIALLAPATLEGFEYGALGPVLLLLIALTWRYRDRMPIAASAIAGAVVLQLFSGRCSRGWC
jgi:hypothetical protein